MSVGFAILAKSTNERGFLVGNLIEEICTSCAGIAHTQIDTLCDTHFFEWQEEKMYMELEMSTEGLYI